MKSKLAVPIAAAVVVGLALGMSACSSDSSQSAASTPTSGSKGSSDIALPDSIAKKGYIDVGDFDNYPPYTMLKDGKLQGVEPDLLHAIGAKLGVDIRFHSLGFEAMIPSVVNGRSDMLIGMFADTADRRKQVSFLDLAKTEMVALVPQGNPKNVDPTMPCGLTSGQQTGSEQATIIKELSDKCVAAGKPAIKQLGFSDPGGPFLAMTSGRIDLNLQDPALASYTAKQDSRVEALSDKPVAEPSAQYEGWVFGKDDTELQNAFVKAIDELIADGEWQKILASAGLSAVALNPPLVNTQPAATN